MSDQLAASLARLHNARNDSSPVSAPPSVEENRNGSSRNHGLPSETTEPTVPTRALAARRQRHLNLDNSVADGPVPAQPAPTEPAPESPWVAAAQGHLPHLDDSQKGKPRIALSARAALAGVLALLALGGGIMSAHLLTAQAKPAIVIGMSDDEQPPVAPESENPTDEQPSNSQSTGVPQGEVVVVHVAGAVAQPGIVTLPQGARVAGAVELAGGATPEADLTSINLARVLVDGEQILIPIVGQALPQVGVPAAEVIPPAPTIDLTQAHDESGRINLNQASATLLQELPGIGPALAGRIIEYRESIGGFTSIDQLQEVSGIGPSVMNNVRDKVSV